MDKPKAVYLYNGILFGNKKNQVLTDAITCTTLEKLGNGQERRHKRPHIA